MSTLLKRLVILGAGGHGRVVGDIAEQLGFTDIAFVDVGAVVGQHNLHWPVIGRSFADVMGQFSAFVAIGNNTVRLKEIAKLKVRGLAMPTLVHGSASVSPYAALGAGSVIMPQVVINAGAKLGSGVIANSGCTIDHDCMIGDGVHISPGANLAGGVVVGECSWVGIGASVREGVNVGRNVTIGAGSVVINSVVDDAMVFGVPARLKGMQ